MSESQEISHILIIEQEGDTRTFLEQVLCRANFDTTSVPDMGAAKTAMGIWTPHAIVVSLDACMAPKAAPKVIPDAVPELCCAMKQNLDFIPDCVPVLLLVDNTDSALLQYIDDARIYTYVTEPSNTVEFIKKVRRACDYGNVCRERDAALEALQRSRAYTEAFLQSVGDIIISFDAQGNVLRMNNAGLNALQLELDAVVNRPWRNVLQTWREQFDDALTHAIESREIVSRERVVLCLDDGEELNFELSAAPVQGRRGEHLGAVLSMCDVTRFVRANSPKRVRDVPSKYGLVGNSAAMLRVEYLLRDLAPTDTTVLILGESGTGKELVAEALHNAGPRATAPLVKVNCSALPETLLESELFGHVRGAFTGAVRDRVGRFQLAHGGTIFLDEIGDISPQVQLRLLRVLQEREFERVGDTRTMRVNVRIIAATNSNLQQLVATGRFREDLYYRLRVVEVALPPLRKRLEDVALLTEHFIRVFNEKFSRSVVRFSDAALRCLLQYNWPGNVRELRHAVEHGFILCKDDIIDVRHLPRELREKAMKQQSVEGGPRFSDYTARSARPELYPEPNSYSSQYSPLDVGSYVLCESNAHSLYEPDTYTYAPNSYDPDTYTPNTYTQARPPMPATPILTRRSLLDEELLRDALVHAGGNKAKAARLLGISRQTLYRKLVEFGLKAD